MDRAEQLGDILKRLNSGENPEQVKEQARDFLVSVKPEELSMAEQKLLKEGLDPSQLRHLCAAHLEAVKGELEKMKARLKPGHVLHTFVCEHDLILGFLDDLEQLNEAIQKMADPKQNAGEFEKLLNLAEHLVGAESHYKREEEVLFPELEKREVTGPPRIMRMEHEELRKAKKELKTLAECKGQMDSGQFKNRLSKLSEYVVTTLRDHIFKENNILYPTALQVIQDQQVWERLRSECDRIGYCCFTPTPGTSK